MPDVSRRRFLLGASAAAITAALPSVVLAPRWPDLERYNSAGYDSWRLATPEEILEYIRKAVAAIVEQANLPVSVMGIDAEFMTRWNEPVPQIEGQREWT